MSAIRHNVHIYKFIDSLTGFDIFIFIDLKRLNISKSAWLRIVIYEWIFYRRVHRDCCSSICTKLSGYI